MNGFIARRRRQVGPARDVDVLRSMLIELLSFVTEELDADPTSWSDYFVNPAEQQVADSLESECA